jgi:hypothetical protein
VDLYRLTLDTALLCDGQDSGLFYYELLFLRGAHTLFTDSINNVDFSLSEQSKSRFRLLICTADFKVPAWFAGGTMYHIFVDRFFRSGKVPVRDDAILLDNSTMTIAEQDSWLIERYNEAIAKLK